MPDHHSMLSQCCATVRTVSQQKTTMCQSASCVCLLESFRQIMYHDMSNESIALSSIRAIG